MTFKRKEKEAKETKERKHREAQKAKEPMVKRKAKSQVTEEHGVLQASGSRPALQYA